MKIKLLIFAAALVFAGVSASAQCKGKCRGDPHRRMVQEHVEDKICQ